MKSAAAAFYALGLAVFFNTVAAALVVGFLSGRPQNAGPERRRGAPRAIFITPLPASLIAAIVVLLVATPS